VVTSHKVFDLLQTEGKHFVCRIKASTTKTIIEENPVNPNSFIFYGKSSSGTTGKNQTKIPLRVVGYKIGGVEYFVAQTGMILQPNKLQQSINQVEN
jgi:hypothetical protein